MPYAIRTHCGGCIIPAGTRYTVMDEPVSGGMEYLALRQSAPPLEGCENPGPLLAPNALKTPYIRNLF